MLEPPAPPGWRIVGVVGPAVAKFDDQGNAGALGKKVADEQGSERRRGGEDRIRSPLLEEVERALPRRGQPADALVGKIEQQLIGLGEEASMVGGPARPLPRIHCCRTGARAGPAAPEQAPEERQKLGVGKGVSGRVESGWG